jgi:hypothetical protein
MGGKPFWRSTWSADVPPWSGGLGANVEEVEGGGGLVCVVRGQSKPHNALNSELVGVALSDDHYFPKIRRISMGRARGRSDKRDDGRGSKGCGRRRWVAEGRQAVDER